MTAMNYRLLNFVRLKSLDNWRFNDIGRYDNLFRAKTVYFKEIIGKTTTTKEKIIDNKKYPIIGVRAYGNGAFISRIEKGENLKMKVYQVCKKNHLIWCKVDTKNGAFGIITESFENSYASSNMSLAKIDLAKVNLDYLQLIFKFPKFNSYMDNAVTGSTNRRYLTFEQILNTIQIPLPDLPIQEQVVCIYNKKLTQAQEAENQANELEKNIENYLLSELGIEKPKAVEKKEGLQFVKFKEINSWSIDKISYNDLNNFKNAKKLSDESVMETFRGKSPKYEENGKAIILNQKCNRWNEIKLEFAKTVNKDWFNSINKKFKTLENDILINSTGDGTIGRSSLVTKDFEDLIYDSHILLLRLNQEVINPTFFVYQFNSTFIQNQIEQIKSAQSTKQTELGLENLFKLNFSIPQRIYDKNGNVDIENDIQTKIANHITTEKEKIKSLRQQAEDLRKQAKETFENEIFA